MPLYAVSPAATSRERSERRTGPLAFVRLEAERVEQTGQRRAARPSRAASAPRVPDLRVRGSPRARLRLADSTPDCARSAPVIAACLCRRAMQLADDCACRRAAKFTHQWDLTFDMSGGGQTAQLAGRRPLDGGVRFLQV